MFLMYVDECGDYGMNDGASRYFILSALVIPDEYWRRVMEKMATQRAEFKKRYGFPINGELHATEMLGRTGKDYADVGKVDRLIRTEQLRQEAQGTQLVLQDRTGLTEAGLPVE